MKKFFFLFFISIISYGLFAQTLEKIEAEVSFVSEVTLSELEKNFVSIVNLKTPLGIKTFRVMKNSSVIDSNSVLTKFRCWGIVEGKDRIHLNRPYMGKLDYDPAWGFSTRSIKRNLRLLG